MPNFAICQKYPNKGFLIPNLRIFVFRPNFAIRQIWGCWFLIGQYCFHISPKKYPNQAFLVRNLGILVFWSNFANRQNWGGLISNMTTIFFKFSPNNTQITHFWVQIYAFLFFCQIFQVDKFKGIDFKYDNTVFKFQFQNICVFSGISGPKLRHFSLFVKFWK